MTTIQIYTPTNEAADKKKEDVYNWLQYVITGYNKQVLIVIKGGFSAYEGEDNSSREEVKPRKYLGMLTFKVR